jgi:hypothetical protein
VSIRVIALPVLAAAAVMSLARAWTMAVSESGGTDAHALWFNGQLLLAGVDPYRAWAEASLGGATSGSAVAMSGKALAPTNLAPFVLVLGQLAWLDWPAARLVLLLVNLAVALVCPWLALRLLPPDRRPDALGAALLACAFLAFSGTRAVLWLGQTTLLAFAAMLLAPGWRRRALLAGLALGFALSKYSVGVAAAVVLALDRRWAVLGVALAVQTAGLLVVSVGIGGTSPIDTVRAHIGLLVQHADLAGIHLAGQLPGASGHLLAAALTVWSGVAAVRLTPRGERIAESRFPSVATLACAWCLLVGFHRSYDSLVAYPLLLLAWRGGVHRAHALGACIVLWLPGELLADRTAGLERWLAWRDALICATMFVTVLVLGRRLGRGDG